MKEKTPVVVKYSVFVVLFLIGASVIRFFYVGSGIDPLWLFDRVVGGTIAGLVAAIALNQMKE